MRYGRNDNYWASPTVIDGVEYDTPFIDELIYVIIKDHSTRVAALRTAKLDVYYWMPVKEEQSLAETAPDLEKFRYLSSGTHALGLRSDIEPLSNQRLRHALSMALDSSQIAETVLLEAQTEGIFPMIEGYSGHIPPDQLDPEIRAVYEYHPDRAKEILGRRGLPARVQAGHHRALGGLHQRRHPGAGQELLGRDRGRAGRSARWSSSPTRPNAASVTTT